MIKSILVDLADNRILQGVKTLIGQGMLDSSISTIQTLTSVERRFMKDLENEKKKAIFALKNAIFIFKNNIRCEDVPLTNVSLETSKFFHLSQFIKRDAGIKATIANKYGDVAFKELEMLVAVHYDRGDDFISKFIEKNVRLYHSLRNTALSKILVQISVVHSKVNNIEIPEAATNSEQYHDAIKRLDEIVSSNHTKKMQLIEDIKFDFEFLSTILLVWRTETSKQADASNHTSQVTLQPMIANRINHNQAKKVLERIESVEDNPDDPEPLVIEDSDPRTNRMTGQSGLPPTPVMRQSASSAGQTRPGKIATAANPMTINSASGELPIKTKCTQCPDRNSENMTDLIHHYATMHLREQIEQKYAGGLEEQCAACNTKLSSKVELIKHMAIVHKLLKLEITQTERWICDICKKEFLTNDFLKKHMIKVHLSEKFESKFLAMNEKNELLCQFCDDSQKPFTYKKNLFTHIGLDHNKLEEIMPSLSERRNREDDIKCRYCDLESGVAGLMSHYALTHYRESFLGLCQTEQLLSSNYACRFCRQSLPDQEALVSHLAVDHNLIFKFIANFHGKNVNVKLNPNPPVEAVAAAPKVAPEVNVADQADVDLEDPLALTFVDTDSVSSPVKSAFSEGDNIQFVSPAKLGINQSSPTKIKIVSPTKLFEKSEYNKTVNTSQNSALNVSNVEEKHDDPQEEKREESISKKQNQNSTKECERCHKYFLASKLDSHIVLQHIYTKATSELQKLQAVTASRALQCPKKKCKSNKFMNKDFLLVHFTVEHTNMLKVRSDVRTQTRDLETIVINEEGDSQAKQTSRHANKTNWDHEKIKTPTVKQPLSPWVEKFKSYCQLFSDPDSKAALASGLTKMSDALMERYLVFLTETPSNISLLSEVVAALVEQFSSSNLAGLPTTTRHLLLADYVKHCHTLNIGIQTCSPMQIIILLSQLLTKPGVKPVDLEWFIKKISDLHDRIDGALLTENKKIIDFFEAIGVSFNVEKVSENEINIIQPVLETVECRICKTTFSKKSDLVKHSERCKDPNIADELKKNRIEEAKKVAVKFKERRSSLGLSQKKVLAHMKSLLGPDIQIQTIDITKFELNHSQQAMEKFLPHAEAWLAAQQGETERQAAEETSVITEFETEKRSLIEETICKQKIPSKITSKPSITPKLENERLESVVETIEVEIENPTKKYKMLRSELRINVSKMDMSMEEKENAKEILSKLNRTKSTTEGRVIKNRIKSEDASSNSRANIVVKVEKEELKQKPARVASEPILIDLEEEEDDEEKVYRYFCLECEGCDHSSCRHLSHPRVPLPHDISPHIQRTGHVAVSPISGYMSLPPMADVAYSLLLGGEVRKQWKDLVLAGSYIPTQYNGVRRCKFAACSEIFEDAVEAFKHIRDKHLKSGSGNSVGSGLKRKSTSFSRTDRPPSKAGKF